MSEKRQKTEISPSSAWRLPEGIESHIESFMVKATVGAAVGVGVGTLLFRRGNGWRVACANLGLGVAVGSSSERLRSSK